MKLLKIYKNISSGFSVMEVVVALGIIAMLLGMGLFVNFDSFISYQFLSEEKMLANIIRIARNKALNNVNHVSHGVHVGEHDFILFEDVFDEDSSQNQYFPRNRAVEIMGSSEVIFQSISGIPLEDGQFTLTLAGKEGIIRINQAGNIND